MALTIDQQSQFKHFCKICKKGFLCGRALGGHMRAHGIGDEGGCLDDDDQASDWEDKSGGGNTPPREKRMYALRTNPNRQKCYRACENCGKEFSSWKSFLEHGKCNSDDVESLVSSPEYDGEDGFEKRRSHGSGWSKRKRSFRTNVENNNIIPNNICPSSEEEDLANCLMMLSNAMVDTSTINHQLEESCASASKEEERRNNPITFINPFSTSSSQQAPSTLDYKAKGISSMNSKGLFECKACKKVFTSHQALGGHRASHKKVKGCFAARLDHMDQDSLGDHEDHRAIANDPDFTRPTKSICTTLQLDHSSLQSPPFDMPKKKSKVHECSICHRVFNSGQALGGHKRCHWITSNAPDPSSLARFQELREQIEQIQEMPMFKNDRLDLNIPSSHDQNIMGIERNPSSTLSFQVSTDIFLQPWTTTNDVNIENEHNHHHKPPQDKGCEEDKNGAPKKNTTNGYDLPIMPNNNKDDEADSKMKLARICEIKDHMSTNGCSSPWLQVGIGSSNPLEANP